MMKALKEVNNKKLGLYIRKEKDGENLSTGYGRLQWLRHELEEYEGSIQVYIDEENQLKSLKCLTYDVIDGKINAVLIWTIDELINVIGMNLMTNASVRDVPIISFCEAHESISYMIEHIEDVIKDVFKVTSNRGENNND